MKRYIWIIILIYCTLAGCTDNNNLYKDDSINNSNTAGSENNNSHTENSENNNTGDNSNSTENNGVDNNNGVDSNNGNTDNNGSENHGNIDGSGNIGGNGNIGGGENSGSNTEQKLDNTLSSGSNIIDMKDDSKQLHTLIYNLPEQPADDYSISSTFTINGQNALNTPFAKVLQYKYFSYNFLDKNHDEHYHKDKELMDHMVDFNNFINEKDIKPIKKNPYIMRKVPSGIQVGTLWSNIYVLENNTYKTINAKCIAVSAHAYFFLDTKAESISDEQLQLIIDSFDKDYTIVHEKFGVESDIDNNGKVIFLITNLADRVMGFFYSADKYKNSQLGGRYKSNEADILYVNYKYFAKNMWEQYKTDVLATFIHEFQHMTLFDTRVRENLNPAISVWLNEGLSMLAEYYGGYAAPHKNYIASFLQDHQGFTLIENSSGLDYGYSLLFTRYLQERFGDSFVKKIYSSQYTGVDAVSEAVDTNFNTLFQEFANMIMLTGRNITKDPRYNIDAFNYAQGTPEYSINGFNLAEIVDETYSRNKYNNLFITTKGYSSSFMPYSIRLTAWTGIFYNIDLSGDNAKGFYAVY